MTRLRAVFSLLLLFASGPLLAASASHAAEAKRFVDYVLSPVGREILSGYGFGQPE